MMPQEKLEDGLQMTSTALIILGMHRSGTSCLTGLFEEAGVWLGEVRRMSSHNAKGNRENPEIMALNDAILKTNGATWDKPPDRPMTWSAIHLAERGRILAGYPAKQIWGFKDPRTLFTLEGWRSALPGARLVGILRHPLAVARSLEARNKIPLEHGLALWAAYNRRLFDLVQSEDMPILSFDQPAAHFVAAATALIEDMGLGIPLGGMQFFDDSLRHQTNISDRALPADIAVLYSALQERITA